MQGGIKVSDGSMIDQLTYFRLSLRHRRNYLKEEMARLCCIIMPRWTKTLWFISLISHCRKSIQNWRKPLRNGRIPPIDASWLTIILWIEIQLIYDYLMVLLTQQFLISLAFLVPLESLSFRHYCIHKQIAGQAFRTIADETRLLSVYREHYSRVIHASYFRRTTVITHQQFDTVWLGMARTH